MSKTDGTNDKINAVTGKKISDDAKTNDINRQYEKALNTKDKPQRDPSNSRALRVPAERQIQIAEKKIKERREKRVDNLKPTNRQTRLNRLLRNRNTNKNLLIDENHDDFDNTQDQNNHRKKELVPDIDFENQSNQEQNNDNNDDNNNQETDKNITAHYKQNKGDLYIDSVDLVKKDNQLNPNSQEYLSFLKKFVNNFDTIPPNEVIIQKAIVNDTIGQMFDQFLMGMNSFDKNTKQHQTFGQGAHLCQKILISLKHDDMPTAQTLIKRLLPKR
jgi:hypothetical protein